MVPDRQSILFRCQRLVFLYKNFRISGHDNLQCHFSLTAFVLLEFLNYKVRYQTWIKSHLVFSN